MNDLDEIADAAARDAARDFQSRELIADEATVQLLFTKARTHYGWQDRDVSEETLHDLYEIAKMGPTSMNQQPMRVVFIRSSAAKDRLEPALFEGNRAKMRSAPVTAIIAYDLDFWEELPKLFPPNPAAQDIFKDNEAASQVNAFRNGTLQGAYFMLAARAVGLDIGAMSGFDNNAVDAEFFADTSLKSNFLVNLGYADTSKIFRQLPRMAFDDACETL